MRYDIDQIKQANDCRVVVETELGAPRYHYGGYSQWRSPFGQGNNQNTFTAWADHWECWVTGEKGDVIGFIMALRGLDFKQACEYLGGNKALGVAYKQPTARLGPAPKPVDLAWVADVHHRSVKRLWDDRDPRGMDYLKARGLWPEVIEQSQLGFVPPELASKLGLKMGGILIPALEGGQVVACQIRALSGQFRYGSIGSTGGRLFGVDDLREGWPVVAFEGAFDALIARQLGLTISTVATFGAANLIAPHFYPKLLSAPLCLVFGDHDEAGRAWMAKHEAASPSFKPIHLPYDETVKLDLNRLYLLNPDVTSIIVNRYLKAYQFHTHDPFEAFAIAMHGARIEDYHE